MTTLSLKSLTCRFGDVVAVDGIDLEIGDHELVSLLGPSGCGKTTTLRCIAGFESHDGGDILFVQASVTGLPPEKRDLGMVFQNYALFPHMTVSANLAYGLQMRKTPRQEAPPGPGRVNRPRRCLGLRRLPAPALMTDRVLASLFRRLVQ